MAETNVEQLYLLWDPTVELEHLIHPPLFQETLPGEYANLRQEK